MVLKKDKVNTNFIPGPKSYFVYLLFLAEYYTLYIE